MALTSGTKLGPYEIQSPLGAGGMGEVYRARDTRLERSVAIKILPAHFSSDPLRKQRFEREAKTISNLNHPHICVLHDVGSQDGIDYLVMECVEGETLVERELTPRNFRIQFQVERDHDLSNCALYFRPSPPLPCPPPRCSAIIDQVGSF